MFLFKRSSSLAAGVELIDSTNHRNNHWLARVAGERGHSGAPDLALVLSDDVKSRLKCLAWILSGFFKKNFQKFSVIFFGRDYFKMIKKLKKVIPWSVWTAWRSCLSNNLSFLSVSNAWSIVALFSSILDSIRFAASSAVRPSAVSERKSAYLARRRSSSLWNLNWVRIFLQTLKLPSPLKKEPKNQCFRN